MAGQSDEGHIRDALRLHQQVIVEMMDLLVRNDRYDEDKGRWKALLDEAKAEVDAIRVRGEQKG